jgi:hydroxymethylpyrimidine pyrophosphatase-like HAD family hydrolase
MRKREKPMTKKEEILKLMEEAELSDIEILKEEESLTLVRFFYDFDEDELRAAENFAKSESEEEEESAEVEETAEVDLAYDEDEEFFGDDKQKYLSEIAIDHVGEILEDLQDELMMEIQYVGYNLDEGEYDAFEFIAVIFEKGQALNIEDILDELDI